jgi:hypothetical protein
MQPLQQMVVQQSRFQGEALPRLPERIHELTRRKTNVATKYPDEEDNKS